MKKIVPIIVITTVLAVAVCVSQVTGDSLEAPDLAVVYAAWIDDTIKKGMSKAKFLDSKSPNIRRDAFRSCLKAMYLKAHKEEMITYLLNTNGVINPDRVQYHINKNFYKAYQPDKIYDLFEANHLLKS
ncbi:MAG: hypothetical protein JRJ27_19205 [Deltaproteobacteria bacterium]|nr:hypothetical protein [Deltaproteobacteria bacterium]